MAPEWWQMAEEMAQEHYDPAENGGVEWDDLTPEQVEELVLDAIGSWGVG